MLVVAPLGSSTAPVRVVSDTSSTIRSVVSTVVGVDVAEVVVIVVVVPDCEALVGVVVVAFAAADTTIEVDSVTSLDGLVLDVAFTDS